MNLGGFGRSREVKVVHQPPDSNRVPALVMLELLLRGENYEDSSQKIAAW